MTTHEERQLFDSLQDKEYRDVFVDELISGGLAYQVRALREKNGWTQAELASRTCKAQETISQLENPDYGSYTLKTLKTLASAFDVALRVNFVSFRELIVRATNLTPETITPPTYSEDYRMPFANTARFVATSVVHTGVGSFILPDTNAIFNASSVLDDSISTQRTVFIVTDTKEPSESPPNKEVLNEFAA